MPVFVSSRGVSTKKIDWTLKGNLVKQKGMSRIKSVSGRLRRVFQKVNERTDYHEKPMPRLLVVDDEKTICFSMSEYFSLQGFKVDTARDVSEAAELVANVNYEVIIQDLRLGPTRNADGLQIVKLARAKYANTRIVVLTAYGSVEMEDEAIRCGAGAFLQKPKPLSQVAQVVQNLMESPVRVAMSV